MSQRIRIKLQSYDHNLVDKSAEKIVKTVRSTGAVVTGPRVCRLEMVHMAETYKGDAYCVKCKEKREFEGTVKVSDSGRRMAQGICPVCGTKVNRILGKAQ